MEGPGFEKPVTVEYRDIAPREQIDLTEKFTTKRPGERRFVINFTSKEIHNIHGSTKVMLEG